MNKARTAITPTRAENYPEWYQQIITAADLAENAPVRGCMIIKPRGYAIWENIQRVLDGQFKATGHKNAYFPLLIPLSFLEKEAEHIEGFAKECAVVTHHRLETHGNKLVPAGELEEPLIIRPTSETIIGEQFSKWVQSYRDLPLKINQWVNVMRWEMRTRLFLRTSEFLWQEGHTAHATSAEAQEESLLMLEIYAKFARDYLAMPVVVGEKTADERFPGAENTYTIEALMQDKKALQAGTSHFLGQNFSKSFEIKFLSNAGSLEHVWTTSWGVSTRLIGGLIMTHSDDDGLVLPPRIAPIHIVILPIYRNDEERAQVLSFCNALHHDLAQIRYHHYPLMVEIDDRDINGGEKTWQHIKQGMPIRVEVGPRDIANNSLFVGRRDKTPKEKQSIERNAFINQVTTILDEIQGNLYQRALTFLESNIVEIADLETFTKHFSTDDAPGFAKVFCSPNANYLDVAKPLKVTARCIPLDNRDSRSGKCIFSGEMTSQEVMFAKAY
jgi:prolyl-tRNA synthetase